MSVTMSRVLVVVVVLVAVGGLFRVAYQRGFQDGFDFYHAEHVRWRDRAAAAAAADGDLLGVPVGLPPIDGTAKDGAVYDLR